MIPIIDFRGKNVEDQMYNAYTTCGFAVFTNVYDSWLSEFSEWNQLMKEFFRLSIDVKKKYAYSGVTENIGYSWLEEVTLNPARPGDINESYNWVEPSRMQEQYWPKEIPEFKSLAQKIERIARLLSYEFLYKFENILKLKRGQLVEQHVDGSSTMRIIHYPAHDQEVKEDQIRGGEHTDYGSITLLWRFDDNGGLQIQDKRNNEWIDAPVIENSIVLNVADMFARWSNDTFKSTSHRVVNIDLSRSRYSMPYFVDPGRKVMIKNLTDQPDKHSPISAYEYLKWRLSKSYVDNEYTNNEEVEKEGKQYLPEEQL